MNSITKEEIQAFLWKSGITPHAKNFKQVVLNFLLEKFNLLSYEVEDEAYDDLSSKVQEFQWKLQAFAKRKTPKGPRMLKLHRVRHFIYLVNFTVFSSGAFDKT